MACGRATILRLSQQARITGGRITGGRVTGGRVMGGQDGDGLLRMPKTRQRRKRLIFGH